MSAILIQRGAPTFFHVNEEHTAEIDYILFFFLKEAKALASIVPKQHGSKSEEVPRWIGAPRCMEVRSLVWQNFFSFLSLSLLTLASSEELMSLSRTAACEVENLFSISCTSLCGSFLLFMFRVCHVTVLHVYLYLYSRLQ